MRNKGLAIIGALLAPWALLAYAAYKYSSYKYQRDCCSGGCKCKNK